MWHDRRKLSLPERLSLRWQDLLLGYVLQVVGDGVDAVAAGHMDGIGSFAGWMCHGCEDDGVVAVCARCGFEGALIESLHLSHSCSTVTGAETVASLPVELGVLDFVRLLLVFFQCCFYVSCSSWRRPWWILSLACAARYHCRCMVLCRAVSLAAACVVAWDDVALGGWCHAASIASALVAPMFSPKRSNRGQNLKRENWQGAHRLLLVVES